MNALMGPWPVLEIGLLPDKYGLGAGVWKCANRPTIGLLPEKYGQHGWRELVKKGDEVWLVDFSYPAAELKEIESVAKRLVVLDHHASAEAAVRGCKEHAFDVNKSGARLAWEWFHGQEEAPFLVRYVEDRDLWKWELAGSREFNAGLRTWPLTVERYRLWVDGVGTESENRMADQMISAGKTVMRTNELLVEKLTASGRERWARFLGAYKAPIWEVSPPSEEGVPCVNSPTLQSEVCEELLRKWRTAPFAAVWWDEGQMRIWSLRSRKDGVDVSKIAEVYGGGGHRNAAGFTLKFGAE
jgi:hypothetical protein